MENASVLNNTNFRKEFFDDVRFNNEKSSFGKSSFSPAILNMIEEGGISFLNYLKSQGLSKETNLMVLSSKHHYYYDEEDLKNIRTLVNLKKLNLVKRPNDFLNTLFRILPAGAHFVGCFSDSKSLERNVFQPSKLLNRFINILDSRTDRSLNRIEVTELLASHGFKVLDITEIDGTTYFNARPVMKPVEMRA